MQWVWNAVPLLLQRLNKLWHDTARGADTRQSAVHYN